MLAPSSSLAQRLLGQFVRLIDLAFLHRELAQAQEHLAATGFEIGLVAKLERAVEVAAGGVQVPAGHQDQAQVVLRASQRDPVAQHLEDHDRAHRVPGGGLPLPNLLVRGAERAVHARNPAQVEHRTAGLDRRFVRGDRAIPLTVGDVGAGEDAQQPSLGRRGHRFQAAADAQRQLGQRDRVFGLRHVRERGLGADALGQHHAIVHGLEVGTGLGEQGGRVVRLGRTQVGLAQQEADPAEARRGERAVEQGEAERDGFVVAAVGDHGLERDQLSLRLVRSGRGLGEEELDRLARAAGDVFERGQRRPGASGLDQVDRRCGDMPLAQLGQAQA